MAIEENIFDTVDYRGVRVVFTRKKWKEKSVIHPELNNKVFLRNLKEAIKNPEQVWPDYKDYKKKKGKRCYYKKYSKNFYVKAVIWVDGDPCQVISAYLIDYIKESKYPELRRLI